MAMELSELTTAEEWLTYFNIPYQPRQLKIGRLAMLHRFNRLLAREEIQLPKTKEESAALTPDTLAQIKQILQQAYTDSVEGSVPEATGWTDAFESNCSKCASKCEDSSCQ